MSVKSLVLSLLSVSALLITFMETGWAGGTEVALHKFSIPTPFSGAGFPFSGLAMDTQENLYGTTNLGGPGTCGSGCGVVFRLTKGSNGNFAYSVIHTFAGSLTDGGNPNGAPILDSAGNVFGTAATGGESGCGVVYELSPNAAGKYQETILHSFNSHPLNDDGCNPESFLVFDKAGNLYGTTNKGGGGGVNGTFCLNGCGSVFKLAPNGDGTFTESVIHSFPGTPGSTDGQNPVAGLVLDDLEISGVPRSSAATQDRRAWPSGLRLDAALSSNSHQPPSEIGKKAHSSTSAITILASIPPMAWRSIAEETCTA